MTENSEITQDLEGQRKRLQESLKLEESISWLREDTSKKIKGAIVQTIFDLVLKTDVPIENISVFISGGDQYGSPDDHILFYWDKGTNKAKFGYIRGFIWGIGERMEQNTKKSAEAEVQLISETAHEMYHIREAMRFPKSFEGLDFIRLDWAEDRAELAAQIFALHYLKTRPQTPAVKKEIHNLTENIRRLKRHRRKQG